MEEITLQEVTHLAQLEDVIQRGLSTFVDVGNALLEIRDSRLYRESHSTFEDYCRDRWGMVRQQANRLIAAAEVTANLEPIGSILPTSESVVRPLASLPADVQRTVWADAVASAPNGKPTAAHVASVAQEYMGAPREPRSTPHVSHNSGNNEWYTPAEYIEAARRVMGGIDLDPASSAIANEVVNAGNFYTAEDNGLQYPWFGCVWMNPPYSSDLVSEFADKMAWEYQQGNVTEAIVLINNATETRWFRTLIDVASAVVFPSSRVKFWKPDGDLGAPLQGQSIIYLGKSPSVFLSEFNGFGWGATL